MSDSEEINSLFDDFLSLEDFLLNFPLPKSQNDSKEKNLIIEIPTNENNIKIKDIINKNNKRIFSKK